MSTSPRATPRIVYPDSDGKPMADNTLQWRWNATIKSGLDVVFRDRPDVFVAGEGGIGEIEFEGETIEEDGVTYPGTGPGDWVGDDRAEFRISISNGIGDVEVSRA